MSDITVYTAIFGDYDYPYRPGYSSSIPHICISDSTDEYLGAYKVLRKPLVGSPRLSSRYYKINSHIVFPSADFTIWHGGNVQLLQSPEALVDFLGDSDIAVLRLCLRRS